MKFFICLFTLVVTAMSADSGHDLLKAGNEQFTAKMFQEVVKNNPGKSIVLSAYSVLSPLAQLALASVGESHDQILKSIGFPDDNATKQAFTDANRSLRDLKGVELKLANRVYVKKDATLNDEFAAVSRDVFNSDAKNLDFSNSVAAASEINTWVEDNTNKRIKELVKPEMFDASTVAVLVNAIYFKGEWTKPFDKELTTDKDFHVSKDKTIKIPTMQKTEDLRYGESSELDAKLLSLPYSGKKSSLLIVLPNKVDGINALVEKLKDPALLSKATENMYINEVEVHLPKFKIETTTNLKEVLMKMNIVKLFKLGEARLENLIKDAKDLYVQEAIQKAYIDINEEGAEAAAANAFVVNVESLVEFEARPILFKVDRPFYFELRHNSLPLFEGIVTQPT